MKLYRLSDSVLKTVKESPFKSEKELQQLVEKNLRELFALELVKSEFSVKSFRIDSLCFDNETQSFVIVEFKKDRNFSVIDQGYTYLSLLLNNKSDFVLEYNERKGKNLKRDQVDWSQSQVVFISPGFTEYQKQSVNFKNVPFRLWEVRRYDNGTVTFSEHKTTSVESLSSIPEIVGVDESKVSKEIKVYTEDYHLYGESKTYERIPWVIDKYKDLRSRILSLGNIEIVPRKLYIGFQCGRPVVDVEIYQNGLKLTVNMKKGALNDPNKLTKDYSKRGHWGNGHYSLSVDQTTDLDYVMFLINQSYKDKVR